MKHKKALIISVIVLAILAYPLFAGISGIVAFSTSDNSLAASILWQEKHLATLRDNYKNEEQPRIDEQSISGFDINAEIGRGAKVNELRYLATHNSYKRGLTPETKFFYEKAAAPFLGKDFSYSFDTFTEQLNLGIRSFELDLSKLVNNGGFDIMSYHHYMFETCTSSAKYSLALEEFKLWSDYNPKHMPIFIMVEPKETVFATKSKGLDMEGFRRAEEEMKAVLGDTLFTSKEFLRDSVDYDELRKNNAYPTLESMMGKIVFFLYDRPATHEYANQSELNTFIPGFTKKSITKYPSLSKTTCMLALDDPIKDETFITAKIKENFMVRTRLDKFNHYSDKQYNVGVNSNANILSTDYPIAITDKYGYTCKLNDENKTIILRY